jgi:hypothetical protein
MTLAADAPRDVVGCDRSGVTEYHLPAKNVVWYSGEIVGMNLSTGIAAPLDVGLVAMGVTPENTKRDLTGFTTGAERIICQSGPLVVPQNGTIPVDSAPGIPVYWVVASNAAALTSNSGANPFLGFLVRSPSLTAVHVDIRPENSTGAPSVPAMQAVNATLALGTITISTGITVAANSEVIPLQIGAITGSTDFGSLRELKASRVNGAPGVGTVVIEAVGSDGAKDVDAAGAIRVVILTPTA